MTADTKAAEIRRLYYQATARTIERDLRRAIELARSMASEDERERVAVYLDGLSQMRSEWGGRGRRPSRTRGG